MDDGSVEIIPRLYLKNKTVFLFLFFLGSSLLFILKLTLKNT